MNLLSMNLLLAAGETTITAGDSAAGASLDAAANTSGWLVMLLVIAIVVVPFIVGSLLANALRMKEYATKLGIIFFTLVLAITPFVSAWMTPPEHNPWSAIRLGIDLAGGTNLVFAVNKEEAEASGKIVNADVMEKMVSSVNRRVNPTGTEEVTVRRVGSDRIEVIVPGADEDKKNQTKRMILDLGKLEFALLANRNEADHASLIAQAERAGDQVDEIKRGSDLIAKWRTSAIDTSTGEPKYTAAPGNVSRTVTRNGNEVNQYLVVVEPDAGRRITGELLKSVRETVSEKGGLAVGFTFNDRGGFLMGQMTSRYRPHDSAGYKNQLAVLLNEQIHSAPTIDGVINTNGQIDGSFTQAEIDELVSVLNAGALQVPLYPNPVSESTISPTLGIDVQRRGITALVVSLIAVFVITAGYYLWLGLIADFCLVLNLILVMGAMALINATFTLPGLAGLVLSIAMAVDSNVLIFERMREERKKGSSVRMAIKNGFDRAFGTIFDSNVTTLITAVILYYVGTDQVKGFAVTLFIGILISMFTAVYVGRVIFEIAERKGWLTQLNMFNAIPAARIDFMGKKQAILTVSAVILVAGLILVGYRGRDNLDIDFRGGTMVAFKFEGESPTSETVRDALGKHFEKSVALERLVIEEGGKDQVLFRMRTIEPNPDVVSKGIVDAFANSSYKLLQQHLQVSEVAAIPAPEAEAVTSDPFAGGHEFTVTLGQQMLPLVVQGECFDFLKTLPALKDVSNLDQLILASGQDTQDVKANEVQVKMASAIPEEAVKSAAQHLVTNFDGSPYFEELNSFDTQVADEAQVAAIIAMIMSVLAIIAYLWIRFQRVSYGLAASIALLFDVLLTLVLLVVGAYLSGNPLGNLLGLEDFKINLTVVAAFMTIIGYSLNDKIVVFDRVREVRGRSPHLTQGMVNQSLNETLSRTLLTAATTLVVILIMYCIGGDGIHAFSYCLFLGIVIGTFSSIFIAAPTLLWLAQRNEKRGTVNA